MTHRYTSDCLKCEAIVFAIERSLGGGGARYMEEVHCPNCGELLVEHMASGSIDVHIVDAHLKDDED